MKFLAGFISVMLLAVLTACTPDISAGSYTTGQVGQAAPTSKGVIIAATPVKVANANGGVGTAVGAIAGGVAGSALGGGTRANVLGALGGAVIGGMAGNYAEQKMSSQTGMQYSVRLHGGKIYTVTQGMDPVLAVGQHVMVIFGNPARVVAAY